MLKERNQFIIKIMKKLKELAEIESIAIDFGENEAEDNLEAQTKNLTRVIYIIEKKYLETFGRIKSLENYIQRMILSNPKSPSKYIDGMRNSYSLENHARILDEKLRMGVPWNKMPTLWIPDDFTNKCQHCCNGFGCFFSRKDHCRKCGGLFCTDCVDNYTFVPPFYTNEKVPVCSTCYRKLH